MEATLAELEAELASLIREAGDIPVYSRQYGPKPVVPDGDLAVFENAHGVTLPAEYREFLLRLGNGGQWPHLLQEGFGGLGPAPWQAWDFRPGAISEPFPHTHGWNDPAGEPVYRDELDGDPAFERRQEEWGRRYFSDALVSGAAPLHDHGCARCSWLVVNGPLSGTIWFDCRADRLGIYPITNHDGRWVRFNEWMLLRVGHARRWLRWEQRRADGPGTVLIRGGSCIVGPLGQVLAGPVFGEETELTADLDPAEIPRARFDFDPVGHYARPDVFKLLVNEAPGGGVEFGRPGTP